MRTKFSAERGATALKGLPVAMALAWRPRDMMGLRETRAARGARCCQGAQSATIPGHGQGRVHTWTSQRGGPRLPFLPSRSAVSRGPCPLEVSSPPPAWLEGEGDRGLVPARPGQPQPAHPLRGSRKRCPRRLAWPHAWRAGCQLHFSAATPLGAPV